MTQTGTRRQRGVRGAARSALVSAARAEIEALGYDGTNTNRIAQRAGYAPQTFYRHFRDKRDVFLALYEHWSSEELSQGATLTEAADLARFLVDHHRRHRIFRRSLRRLSVEDAEVGLARARTRSGQIAAMRAAWAGFASLPPAEAAAGLLGLERLCDAVAEGELAALGVDEPASLQLIVTRIEALMAGRPAGA